jgi:hypothetical protein
MASAAVLHTISKFVLFTFIVVGVFGLLMSMSKDVHISNVKCVVGQTTNGQCPNVPEHISQWENAFIGIISNIDMLLLFILAVVLYVASKPYVNSGRYITDFYVHNKHDIPNLLQLTFARGIAQPTL